MGLPMIPSFGLCFFFFPGHVKKNYRNPHDLHGKNVVKTPWFLAVSGEDVPQKSTDPAYDGTGSIVSSAAVIGAVHRSWRPQETGRNWGIIPRTSLLSGWISVIYKGRVFFKWGFEWDWNIDDQLLVMFADWRVSSWSILLFVVVKPPFSSWPTIWVMW